MRWSVRVLVIYLFLAVVPVMPWRPYNCEDRPLIGELREVYVDGFSRWLDEGDVHYWRLGNQIFLRILGTYDGNENWPNRDDIFNNGEWKVADSVMYDATIAGVFYPTRDVVKRIEALPPPDPNDMDANGERICALFRAAVLEEPY